MKTTRSLCVSLICWLMSLGTTLGATYSIVFDGPLSVQGNTAFSVDVYLQETTSIGELTILGDPNQGLVFGNFEVSIVNGSSSLNRVSGNTAFDTYGGDALSSPWIVNQADLVIADETPFGALTAPRQYRLRIGTISGTSSSSSEIFQLKITDPDASPSDDLVLGDGTVLDSLVFPSSNYSLTVSGNNVVPEPSMCLVFAGSLLLPCMRRRRKKSA